MTKNLFKKENAFTLVEVLMSLVLLCIIFLAFEYAFAAIIRSRQFNQSRRSALNVAKSVLEEVRYDVIQGNYDQVGTTGGSVAGNLEREKNNFTQVAGGRQYDVETLVWWEDEVQENDSIVSDAYKRIEVTVEENSPSYPTSPVTLSTLVAEESVYQESEDSGVIVVEAKRGDNILEPGVFFTLEGPDGLFQSGVTDSEGKIIFANLPVGNYTVTIDDSGEIMAEPEQLIGGFTNCHWEFNDQHDVNNLSDAGREKIDFQIDWPVFVNPNLVNGNGSLIDFNNYPGGLDITFTADSGNHQVQTTIHSHEDLKPLSELALWPRYNYNITIENQGTGYTYNMMEDNHASWDGSLSIPESPVERDADLMLAGVVQAEPESGAAVPGTEITLSSQPSDFDIYYTTDGSDPDLDSMLYDENNKPVVPAGGFTIKAFAYKEGHLADIKEFEYH